MLLGLYNAGGVEGNASKSGKWERRRTSGASGQAAARGVSASTAIIAYNQPAYYAAALADKASARRGSATEGSLPLALCLHCSCTGNPIQFECAVS